MAISPTDNLSYRSPRPLGASHGGQLHQLLMTDVEANLFALSWLEHQGVEPRRPDHFTYWGLFKDQQLQAMALNVAGRLLTLDTPDDVAARCFAHFFRRRQTTFEHVVSRARSVDPFWEVYSQPGPDWSITARLIQQQRLYCLRPSRFQRPPQPLTDLRQARPDELDALFLASVRMHREETLQDPLERGASSFRRHVRHRIDKGRSYVCFDAHQRLLFKADISTRCALGAQISGVYTEPRVRNQGLATRAMTDLCATLFDDGLPRITLYVNETNMAAIRVYERLGFEALYPYRTIFVAD